MMVIGKKKKGQIHPPQTEQEIRQGMDRTAKMRAFLAAYSKTGNITHSCAISGLSYRSHCYWLNQSSNYAAAFKRAKKQLFQAVEAKAYEKAILGMRKKKFDGKGNPVMDPETGEQYVEVV